MAETATHRKPVLITGCSAGGIGYALAESFQRHGFQVFAFACTPAKMARLQVLPNVTLVTLDVTSSSSIAAAVEAVETKIGALQYLINSAGLLYVMPTLDADLSEAKTLFDVNFWGPLALIQAFAPLLLRTGGSIVNISSISGYIGVPWMSIYAASKAALMMASEVLRLEMMPLGVKVLIVNPGGVKTNLAVNSPELKLPPASQYLPNESEIALRAKMDEIRHLSTEADAFAESIVSDVLAHKEGMVWRGAFAFMLRLFYTFLPKTLLETVMKRGSGLEKLRRPEKSAFIDERPAPNDFDKEPNNV